MSDWWDPPPLIPHLTIYEAEKPQAVVYDHNGQPFQRPKVPLGFIDPNNLPGKPKE